MVSTDFHVLKPALFKRTTQEEDEQEATIKKTEQEATIKKTKEEERRRRTGLLLDDGKDLIRTCGLYCCCVLDKSV